MKSPGTEARKAEKRTRILQSAVKIFARRGFYNAKISEIAADAGVADGTIYLYFKNKDDILIAVFEEIMGQIITTFREKIRFIDNPADKLREFILLHLKIVETNPDLASVVQLELRQSNRFIKEYSGTSISDYLNMISDIIQEGQRCQVFRTDIQPGIAKRMLFGALDEIATHWVLSKDRKYALQESAEQISQIVLVGMLVDEARLKQSKNTNNNSNH